MTLNEKLRKFVGALTPSICQQIANNDPQLYELYYEIRQDIDAERKADKEQERQMELDRQRELSWENIPSEPWDGDEDEHKT